jgi:hypothetical protein
MQSFLLEDWVEEDMTRYGPPLYGHDEDFYSWLESLGRYLLIELNRRIREARHEPWEPGGSVPPLPPKVIERVNETLPPHIEGWRQIFMDSRTAAGG